MALITLPPRQEPHQGDPVTFPEFNCCTPDKQARMALLCFYLALLVNKTGGPDFTDCNVVLDEWAQFKNFDAPHMDLLLADMIAATLQANGITTTLEEAWASSACFRNNLTAWQLEAFQTILWNLVVNNLTP